MLRLITCQQATLWVEKRTDIALPLGNRSSLWMHLSYCAKCRRYARQSAWLAHIARDGARRAHPVVLPAAARERLRQRLL
ncbi:anti-sigma factor family protein [Hymenobacter terrenus]|uniref:anti-sigma factor family protein n=1 Tax=Hymenobacter terrenus TaxID=1629124 RepID=UPI0012E034DE|nr:hypothetical protein [Hymenobacter terrenus]